VIRGPCGFDPPLARLVAQNRDYLAPWSPRQADPYFTVDGQRDTLARDLRSREQGLMLPLVILDPGGAVCGRINLNSIIRGAFQSASVGYWVSEFGARPAARAKPLRLRWSGRFAG